jgi:hypothetical protein
MDDRVLPLQTQPGVTKQIRALAELEVVSKAENLILLGNLSGAKLSWPGLLLKRFKTAIGGYPGQISSEVCSLEDCSTRRLPMPDPSDPDVTDGSFQQSGPFLASGDACPLANSRRRSSRPS